MQWLYGGKGSCQFCGVDSRHLALLLLFDRKSRLLFCRDCAKKVRDDTDGGFLTRAMKGSET
jgi:hypothetical protein